MFTQDSGMVLHETDQSILLVYYEHRRAAGAAAVVVSYQRV